MLAFLKNKWISRLFGVSAASLAFAGASFASEGHGFNWVSKVPVLAGLPNHVVMGTLVALLLVVTTSIARSQLSRAMQSSDGGIIPERKLTYRNFFELTSEALYGLTESILGEEEAPKYFHVVGCLFLYIFVSNLMGLIPGMLPPTDDLNVTLALGLFVFIYYNALGFKEHGLGYLKHFMGPVVLLAPLIFVIELVSHLVRPMSLALRLRGNIMGDHLVLSIFHELVPQLVPVIFYGIGLFVCFIQAFVFCLLTMVYISLSTSHDH